MHEMQTILTDDRGVCQSVRLSRGGACSVPAAQRGNSVQALPNNFGLLFNLSATAEAIGSLNLVRILSTKSTICKWKTMSGGPNLSHVTCL